MRLSSWERLAPVVGIICAAALLWAAFSALTHDPCDFCPVDLNDIRVEPHIIQQGAPAMLYDGLCNQSDMNVSAHVSLFLEPQAKPLAPEGASIPLIENRLIVLDPNSCYPEEDPIEVESVPDTVPTGTWRLVIRVMAHGPEGQMQILTRTSDYFEVRPPP